MVRTHREAGGGSAVSGRKGEKKEGREGVSEGGGGDDNCPESNGTDPDPSKRRKKKVKRNLEEPTTKQINPQRKRDKKTKIVRKKRGNAAREHKDR